MIKPLNSNRFATPTTREPATLPTKQSRVPDASPVRGFEGAPHQVFAEAISIAEGFDLMKSAAELRGLPDLDMDYAQRVLREPLLRELFLHWLQGVRSVATGTSAQKVASGEMIFSLVEFDTWMRQMVPALEKMAAAKENTPVDIAAVGFDIIARKADILKVGDNTMAQAPTLTEVAAAPGLDAPARRFFYTQLAKMAVAHVEAVANRTPAAYTLALPHLRAAIEGMARAGEKPAVVEQFLAEAQRISEQVDGAGGKAEQIRTAGLLLKLPDSPVSFEGLNTLDGICTELLALRHTRQTQGAALTDVELNNFTAMLEVSVASPKLFRQMPELIEAITCHPKLKASPGDASATPDKLYMASAAEISTQQVLSRTFIERLQLVFPAADDLGEVHRELCLKSQVLLAKAFAFSGNEGPALSSLVRQMTRYPDLAVDAAQFVSPNWIADMAQRLNAAAYLVRSALENGNIDAAKDHFDARFTENDGGNQTREAQILATAAELVNNRRGDVQGRDVALEWVADAHMRGIDAALAPRDAKRMPDVASAKKILSIMATDYEDWALGARESLNLVNLVAAKTTGWTSFFELHPALVGILARHPEDAECMAKAKALLDAMVSEMKTLSATVTANTRVQTFNYMGPDVLFDAMRVVAKSERLSGYVIPLAETFLQAAHAPTYAKGYAEAVAELAGPPGLRERLAYLLPDAQLTPSQKASVALAWAPQSETNQRARELVLSFHEAHKGIELASLNAEMRAAYIRMEAAVRIGVPGLMTEGTAQQIFSAFKTKNVMAKTVEQVARYMPTELVARVLKNVDYAEAAAIINTATAAAAAATAEAGSA